MKVKTEQAKILIKKVRKNYHIVKMVDGFPQSVMSGKVENKKRA